MDSTAWRQFPVAEISHEGKEILGSIIKIISWLDE
jgi:hypothetical protein